MLRDTMYDTYMQTTTVNSDVAVVLRDARGVIRASYICAVQTQETSLIHTYLNDLSRQEEEVDGRQPFVFSLNRVQRTQFQGSAAVAP